MNEAQRLLSVRNIYKKFSKDIKFNLYYGIQDLLIQTLSLRHNYMKLRKKEFWSLQNINLDLYEGEILGVVGANGSGKTTLMRVISNIYPTDVGAVQMEEDLTITPVFALRAGMQSLFTGRENIFIKGSMYGMTEEELYEKMDFINEFSELGDKLERPFGNYSSGMRARLAYAIAVATEPNVFIIDEALAVGDSVFKAKCFEHLKEYVKQPKKAVLFVSNNIRKVLKVATRVLVMDQGVIIYESKDIREALIYYLNNCLKNISERERKHKLKKIIEYDM
ncbi:MAG: ABC transporter ATP-binding protein [Bacteroidota bacterium]